MPRLFFIAFVLAFCTNAPATTFYLDSRNGNDAAAGTSPATAWKSIQRLSEEPLVGGDSVLFNRGGLWREPLKPKSGTPEKPIVYGAYGNGVKPILQTSTSRNEKSDWKSCGNNLWETLPVEPVLGETVDVDLSRWGLYQEKPAEATLQAIDVDGRKAYRLTVRKRGDGPSRLQFIGPVVPAEVLGGSAMLRLRVRCTKPFTVNSLSVRKPDSPWTNHLLLSGTIPVSEKWEERSAFLARSSAGEKGQFVMYLGDAMEDGSVFEFEPIGLWKASLPPGREPLSVDVGNIVFDHGKRIGFKKWGLAELKEPGDFWYNNENRRVVLFEEGNPADRFESIELCLKRNVVDHSNLHDCVLRNVSLRYSAAHGVGGMGAERVVIEDCDISYIGGGHLYTRNGIPTRYGNGVEWWSRASDCVVRRCRLWEIYDVAFTVQGNIARETTKNITIHDNVIWNCEQSFEYWRTGDGAVTENVVFEHNTCVDAGFGWAHRQRPDKRGTHFLSYHVTAKTNIVLRNNIFCNAKDDSIFMYSDWRNGVKLYNNLWNQPADGWFLCLEGKRLLRAKDFERYLAEFGMERESVLAEPTFIDAKTRDYRLAPGSRQVDLGGSEPTGARIFTQE